MGGEDDRREEGQEGREGGQEGGRMGGGRTEGRKDRRKEGREGGRMGGKENYKKKKEITDESSASYANTTLLSVISRAQVMKQTAGYLVAR